MGEIARALRRPRTVVILVLVAVTAAYAAVAGAAPLPPGKGGTSTSSTSSTSTTTGGTTTGGSTTASGAEFARIELPGDGSGSGLRFCGAVSGVSPATSCDASGSPTMITPAPEPGSRPDMARDLNVSAGQANVTVTLLSNGLPTSLTCTTTDSGGCSDTSDVAPTLSGTLQFRVVNNSGGSLAAPAVLVGWRSVQG